MRGRQACLLLSGIIALLCFAGMTGADSQVSVEALLKELKWRNIGPANMGGRISDIQALDDDFRHVVVASASGGVWKSTNAGTTWQPIFDHYGSASIGALGLFKKNPDIIWVGTGEANVRNSVAWGDGIYKSIDGGKTFTNMGLRDTHHIAKIATHPADPDIVYVAAQGHLWAHTGERGLFKTTDGGRAWQKLSNGLPDDGRTGCTHVIMDPVNPEILYTAFWERLRLPYRFDSGGPYGGLFKSVDGGRSWKKLTRGLPGGNIGRIGIAVYRKNPKILMAIIEHGFQPRRGSSDYIDMRKLGTGIYRSEDSGESWKYLNRHNVRPFYYSQIYINPLDDKRIYVMGTEAQVSKDGGETLEPGMPGIAGDFHVMWLDPRERDRYYVGNDKGFSLTHDHGEHFNFFDNFVISQIYQVSTDNRDPYYVYAGLQDNGVWGGPSNSRDSNGILNDHWFKFHSGDGFYTAVDPADWTTVYTERQGGQIRRNHALFRQMSKNITPNRRNTLNWEEVIPQQKDPDRPVVRMNWNTPFIISPHNPHTLYYGANYLFKSINRGDQWVIISPDLSTSDPEKINRESGGLTRDVTTAETHCTIVTLSESLLRQGAIWAGTDDGQIQLTRDGGATWTNVRKNVPGVPEGIWVSRVEASHHEEGTCYVTFDGHRSDIFQPFVFRTADYGVTWENITGNLPAGHPTYVIREDPKDKKLLFVGTEFACFVSLEGGGTWYPLMKDLPTVAVHDLLIHPCGDLVAGTHGRGVWIMDDITPLQKLTEDVLKAPVYLFENPTATLWRGISRGATRGHQLFRGRNPFSMSHAEPSNSPSDIQNTATINFYLQRKPSAQPVLEISDLAGKNVFRTSLDVSPGINRFRWPLRFPPTEAQTKAFIARMEKTFQESRKKAEVAMKDQLDRLYQQFQKAGSPEKLNQIRQQLVRMLRSLMEEEDFFSDELRGPEAEPGIYLVKLTVEEKNYQGLVAVREDPSLNRK